MFACRKGRFVALKVVRSAQTFTETALDEIKLLKCVGGPYCCFVCGRNKKKELTKHTNAREP